MLWIDNGPGYFWKNLAEVSIVFNSAGWLVGRIAFCHEHEELTFHSMQICENNLLDYMLL